MDFPSAVQASMTRVPFGNCFHSPSTCTLTIVSADPLMMKFVLNEIFLRGNGHPAHEKHHREVRFRGGVYAPRRVVSGTLGRLCAFHFAYLLAKELSEPFAPIFLLAELVRDAIMIV